MVNDEFFDLFEGNFTDLLSHDEKYTFLAGAGISMDAPTKIPSAREIVRTMLELCAPMEEIDNLLSLKMLRYEMMIEKIKNTVDKDLHFLDYLELIDEPNYIHYFLANVIVNRKDYVVTTNFDYMIEKGIQRILESDKHKFIIPVITRENFVSNFRPLDIFKEGGYPLYKIHGSKRNLITGENTGNSLVTTMSALGKDRGIGETFSLESYKKQAIYNLMKNRTLIVMGYSGSDDFDIGPTLQGLPYLSRLIWVEHVQDNTKEIYKVKKNPENIELEPLSQSERILINIASRAEIEVFLVKMKTIDFVKEELWKELLLNVPLPEISEIDTPIIPGFKEWTREEFKNAETSEVKKYMLSCSIYGDLNHDDAIYSNAEKGLKLAESSEDRSSQSYFQNHLGLIKLKKGKFIEALDYFEKSLVIAEQINNPLKKAISLSNIGQIYMRQNERKLEFKPEKAIENYTKALRLFESQQDQWGKIVCLNNLAEASLWEGEQQQALKYLMEALFLVQQLGNLEFKATITNNIGGIISTWDNLDDSLKQVNDSLNIRQEIGDLRGVADCYHNLGDIFFHQNEYNKAFESFNEELEIRKKLKETRPRALALTSIGWVYYRLDEIDTALEKHQEALNLNQDKENVLLQAMNLSAIGFLSYLKGDINSAIIKYSDANTLFTNLGIERKVEETRACSYGLIAKGSQVKERSKLESLLSSIVQEGKNIEERRKILLSEKKKPENLKDPSKNALFLFEEGILLALEGKTKNARVVLEESYYAGNRLNKELELFPLFNQVFEQGIMIKPLDIEKSNFNIIYRDDNDISPEAIEWLPSMDGRQRHREAKEYFDKGYEESENEKYESSIQNFERALEIYEELGDDDTVDTINEYLFSLKLSLDAKNLSPEEIAKKLTEQMTSMTVKGQQQFKEGDKKGAMSTIKSSIRLMRTLGQDEDADVLQEMINSMGGGDSPDKEKSNSELLDSEKGDFVAAAQTLIDEEESGDPEMNLIHEHSEDYYEMISKLKPAIFIAGKMRDIQGKVDGILVLADLHMSGNEQEVAMKRYEQALNSSIILGDSERQSKSLKGIGEIFFLQQDYESALDKFEIALRIYDEKKFIEEKVPLLNRIGQIYLSRGDLDVASERFDEVIKIQEIPENLIFMVDSTARKGEIYAIQGKKDDALNSYLQALVMYEDIEGSEASRLALLLKMAPLEFSIGDVSSAISDYEQAADLMRSMGNITDIPTVSKNIELLKARSLNRAAQFEDGMKLAIKYRDQGSLKEALKIFESLIANLETDDNPNDKLYGTLLQLAAEIHHGLGDLESSMDYFRKSLECYQKVGDGEKSSNIEKLLLGLKEKTRDPKYKIKSLLNDASNLQKEGKLPEALLKFKSLLEIYEKVQDLNGKANCLQNIANIHYNNSEFDDALKNYIASVQIMENLNLLESIYDPQIQIAIIYAQKQDYKQAIEYHQKNLLIAQKFNNKQRIALSFHYLGIVFQNQGNYNKALENLNKGLPLYEESKREDNMALLLENMGICFRELGSLHDALNAFEKARNLFRKLGNTNKVSSLLNDMANINSNLGNIEKCLSLYNEGLKITEEINDLPNKSLILFNMGTIYLSQEDFKKASEIFNKAMEITKKTDIPRYKAHIFMGLGDIDKKKGNLNKSLKKFSESLKIFEKVGDSDGVFLALENIGEIYLKMGQFESAEKNYAKAENIANELNGIKYKAKNLMNYGELFRYKKEFNEALKKYESAIKTFEDIEMPEDLAYCYEKRGEVFLKLKKKAEYLESVVKAHEIYVIIHLEKKALKIREKLKKVDKKFYKQQFPNY